MKRERIRAREGELRKREEGVFEEKLKFKHYRGCICSSLCAT